MPDPKLVNAAEEIKAILKKFDIAGNIVLASQSHTEYVRFVSPSWSCAKLEYVNGQTQLRIRSKLVEFPSKAAQKKCLEDSVGMVMAFANQGQKDADSYLSLAMAIGQKMGIAHWERDE